MPGFNRWVKTWMADFTSVQEIYWRVPGDDIDITRLPQRAFDSAQQRQATEQLFADYNRDKEVTPELDAGFARTGRGAHSRSAPALLRLVAGRSHCRHVAASPDRTAAF